VVDKVLACMPVRRQLAVQVSFDSWCGRCRDGCQGQSGQMVHMAALLLLRSVERLDCLQRYRQSDFELHTVLHPCTHNQLMRMFSSNQLVVNAAAPNALIP
jgi:hypothetical protein